MFRNMVRGWGGDYTDDTCCFGSMAGVAPSAVQKRTLDVYPCDDTWEFINLALLCVACLFSRRKGSMCPGVMIENARKDACTECSICQSPRYAK